MDNILYTIGHSQHKIEEFAKMLKAYKINYVLDVRSTPYSQFAPVYNMESIKNCLKKFSIQYVFMGKNFGARQKEDSLYCKEGYLDFEKVRNSINFRNGVNNVLKGISEGNRIVLMCTEKDPIECHRAIMVAKAFSESGINVEHIMSDGTLQSHADLNKRLLDMYFPNRNQISLFTEDNLSEDECLTLAYQYQNKKIGYRKQESILILDKVQNAAT
ncbi:MAG: DUF488 domain-containing protein [Butyrivibrio sp.]|nr:DUF488 domain-containing protein [Butyrivibrio sp.]